MAGRAYVAGKYALELDGKLAGWVQGFSGGSATSDVVAEKIGPDHIVKKHLAGVKYEDIVVQCGSGMSKAFYDWLASGWAVKYSRKDGAIVAADSSLKEQSRKTFFQAVITETSFPALDAASKDAAKITVKLTPEYTRTAKGSGMALIADTKAVQKKWLPANFKLEIAGLDCTHVNKIEPLVIKQKVVEHATGELRDYEKEPASVEFGNLVVTMAESYADSWYKWFEEFVVKGNCGQDQEKSGSLAYLTPDLKTELFKVTFSNLGIFKLAEEHVEAGQEGIRRVKAEMYVEQMQFQAKGAQSA